MVPIKIEIIPLSHFNKRIIFVMRCISHTSFSFKGVLFPSNHFNIYNFFVVHSLSQESIDHPNSEAEENMRIPILKH